MIKQGQNGILKKNKERYGYENGTGNLQKSNGHAG